MSRILRGAIMMLLLWAVALPLQAEQPVAVIPLKGEVSDAQFLYLRRALKQATRDNARAIILDLDTPGGSVTAVKKMQKALEQVKVPTITYVNPDAISAGALIAVSTQTIYMAPVSAIGAAAPVGSDGQDLAKTMELKSISNLTSYFSSAAEKNGHNPDIVASFIDKEKEFKIGDRVIHEKGAPMSLNAQQATEVIDGKPVLAAGVADDLSDLLKKAGYPNAPIVTIKPVGFESVAFWLTRLAPILLLGGIAGAWIELKAPGFGLPGIVSIICFILFFLGHYIAGLAGWELPVLFFLGLALVFVEFLLLPGLLLPGLLGALMMAGAVLWSMIDRFPGTSWMPTTEALYVPLINLGITALLLTGVMALLARFLPQTKLYRRFVLADAIPAGPVLPKEEKTIRSLRPGSIGVAASDLRPSGSAVFDGQQVDVISRSGFVDVGSEVEVVEVEAFQVAVILRKRAEE